MHPRRNFLEVFLSTLAGLIFFWRKPAAAALPPSQVSLEDLKKPRFNILDRANGRRTGEHVLFSAPSASGHHHCIHCEAWVMDGEVYGFDKPCPWYGPNVVVCKDAMAMMEDIAEHTRKTGDIIFSADLPRNLLVQEEEPLVTPTSTRVLPNRRMKAEVFRHYMKTGKDRETLARAFPGQRQTRPAGLSLADEFCQNS